MFCKIEKLKIDLFSIQNLIINQLAKLLKNLQQKKVSKKCQIFYRFLDSTKKIFHGCLKSDMLDVKTSPKMFSTIRCQIFEWDIVAQNRFVHLPFCRLAVAPTRFIYELQCLQLAILSTCYFHQLLFSSTCYFHQLAIFINLLFSSTCHVIILLFYQLSISSAQLYINMSAYQPTK